MSKEKQAKLDDVWGEECEEDKAISEAVKHINPDNYSDTTRGDNEMEHDIASALGFGEDPYDDW